MKRIIIYSLFIAASACAASEDVELLRKEFEAYKKASDARIQALETELAGTVKRHTAVIKLSDFGFAVDGLCRTGRTWY